MIYLDNHSTTCLNPGIALQMMKCYKESYGNSSSPHEMGADALGIVETARNQVAGLLGVKNSQIYFTNSATEANNVILRGKWQYERRNHKKELNIITSQIEHKSVLNTLNTISELDKKTKIHYIKINKNGTLNLNDLQEKLNLKNILLASVMTANNEIGTINDIKTISKMCANKSVFFHTDATQAVGKVNIDFENINALTFSGHKIHGPKGVGCLYLKSDVGVDPIIDGGYQNRFISGTINVPAISGFGMACEALGSEQNIENNKHIKRLRDLLLGGIMGSIDGVVINGTTESRLINNINISIVGVPADIFLSLPDICISSGSACSSGSHEPSYVLEAIKAEYLENAIRFGLSKFNTEEEIIYTVNRIAEIVKEIRGA